MRHLLLLVLLVFISCESKKNGFRCGTDTSLLPKHGVDGKMLEFNQTGMMDTITTVLTGVFVSLENQEPLLDGDIELFKDSIKYSDKSDLEGKFEFKHIPSGRYQMRCRYVGHRDYQVDTLNLMSGGAYHVIIGIGSKGQDDYD